MIFADWHPDDERLLNRYLDATERDEACERHLATCRSCAGRFAALSAILEQAHESARIAADAAFDSPRLERQHAAILARLGAETRGRLLAFPARAQATWRESRFPSPVRTAAAAAILAMVIGATAGRFVTTAGDASRGAPAVRAEIGQPVAIQAVSRAVPADESIFSDIDLALAQPRTAELRVLDDLTPHARDAVAPVP